MGAWWAAVRRVIMSQTPLKRLRTRAHTPHDFVADGFCLFAN